MKDYNFEKLVGKRIPEINSILNCVLENNLINKNFYYGNTKEERLLYGINYNVISLTTDNNKNITSITIHLKNVIGNDFYNLFIAEYGKPTSILIIEREIILSETESTGGSFNQKMRSGELEMKEGEFNENPLYIIWKKKGYKIKILIRRDRNTTDVIFSNLKKE